MLKRSCLQVKPMVKTDKFWIYRTPEQKTFYQNGVYEVQFPHHHVTES